ncbi:MAG: type II secretion system protein [Campylobacterota bacterium]|nr:type II secretion system protein [Campylobacterota bacterium]
MKQAFTMIELIFVILILGILAVVAIPKLMATRDDARIATMSQSISVAATEIASYAIAKGVIDSDLSVMSYAIKLMVNQGRASVDDDGNATFQMGETADCLIFIVEDGVLDANLTLDYGVSNDPLCDDLQSFFDAREYPIPLKGARVVR